MRLLFPERLTHLREDFPAAQFRRVLENRRGGLIVQDRAVAKEDQRGIGEIITLHASKLAQPGADRKPRPSRRRILLNLLPFSGVLLSERNKTKHITI